MKPFIILLAAALGLGRPALAGTFAAAGQAATWLDLPTSARNTGMGEAGSALAGDVNQVGQNPAALASLGGPQISLLHHSYLLGTALEHAALGLGLWGGGLGVGVDYMNYGSVDAYALNGSGGLQTNGSVNPSGLAVGVGYGHSLGDLSLGLTAKMVSENLDGASASALAADLGGQWHARPDGGLSLGLSLQDWGSSLNSAPLPTTLRAGTAYGFGSNGKGLTLALDGALPTADAAAAAWSLGGEYAGGASVGWALRAGYHQVGNGGMGGLALGLGLKLNRYGLDYAYEAAGALGSTNEFQLSAAF